MRMSTMGERAGVAQHTKVTLIFLRYVWRGRGLAAILVALTLIAGALVSACGARVPTPQPLEPVGADPHIWASFDQRPSGVAVVGERVFVSFPRWFGYDGPTLAEVVDGQVVPWPDDATQDGDDPRDLRSVLGVRADGAGRLWVVDAAARVNATAATSSFSNVARVVVFDIASGDELFRRAFDLPDGPALLNDVAVDERHGHAYLTVTGLGAPSRLIVWDFVRNRDHSALVGHPAISADPQLVLTVDGVPVIRNDEHGGGPWQVGANSVAVLDDHVFVGATGNGTLYRIPSAALRDTSLDDTTRATRLEAWADKPPSDGLAVDGQQLWLTDVSTGALHVYVDGRGATWFRSPLLSFPTAVALTEHHAWVTASQLHLAPHVQRNGQDAATPPFLLLRLPR